MKLLQKRSSRVRKMLLIGSFAFLCTSLFACTRWKDMSQDEKAEYVSDKVRYKLDLTPKQSKKLRFVVSDVLAIHSELKQKKHKDKDSILSLVQSEQIDKKVLLEMWMTHRDAIDRKVPDLIGKISEFHQTLTPEQKNTVAEIINKKFHHH